MTQALPLLTVELAAKVEKAFHELALGAGLDGQEVAAVMREFGIGIVDLTRHRAWIDERVHEGVLLRLRDAEKRIKQAGRHIQLTPTIWEALERGIIREGKKL